MVRRVCRHDDSIPGSIRSVVQGVAPDSGGESPVQAVLEVEAGAGGSLVHPLELRCYRTDLQPGVDEEPTAGIEKPRESGEELSVARNRRKPATDSLRLGQGQGIRRRKNGNAIDGFQN
jgi:hypothetical protein